jgi:hypothetical protein
MADNGTSQVQQTTTLWHSLLTDHMARVESFYAEGTKAFDQGVAQAKTATEESSKVFSAWLEYGVQLSRDFQKLSLEGAKKSLELFQPRG